MNAIDRDFAANGVAALKAAMKERAPAIEVVTH
jgi:hypothetical protein